MLADRALPGGFGHTHALSSSETVYSHSLGRSRHHYFLLFDAFICLNESSATGIQEEGKGKPFTTAVSGWV